MNLTNTPTSAFGSHLTHLDVQDENIYFLAYKQGCDIPPILDLTNFNLDCITLGIVAEDLIVFSEISQFKLLRVGHALDKGITVLDTLIEKTIVKVYEYDLEANFKKAAPLLETSLSTDDKQFSLIFADLDLTALRESGAIAFHFLVGCGRTDLPG